jgi:hypothetical protein
MGEVNVYLRFNGLSGSDREKFLTCLGTLTDPEFKGNDGPPHLHFDHGDEYAALTKTTMLVKSFCLKEAIDPNRISWSTELPS